MSKLIKYFRSKLRKLIFIPVINSIPYSWVFYLGKVHFFSKKINFDFDKIFDVNFPRNKEFKFIQIGANDGISFDDLYQKLLVRKPFGLVIEPSPKYFQQLKANFSNFENIKLINKAIHPCEFSFMLYEVSETGLKKLPVWAKGIGSFDVEHLKKKNLNNEDILQIEVPCISFERLISEFNDFSKVDYLQIDTEGFDFQIIKNIDFLKFNSEIIKFESCNLNHSDISHIKNILYLHGYFVYDNGFDALGIKKDKHIFFK